MNLRLPAAIALAAAVLLDSGCATTPPTTAARPATGTQCAAAGRCYSSTDIDRTGAATAGQALRLLDPAITVHR